MYTGLGTLRLIAPALLGLGLFVPATPAMAAIPTPDDVRAVYVDAGLVVSTPTYSADGVVTFSVDAPGEVSPGWPALRVLCT